jgi:NAD(P)-dependent dehydrogenase (short-subunit alcohol dehydrogenase family)
MTNEFEGRTAFITGAASGIGKAVALALGKAGANVVAVDLRLEAAQKVVDELFRRAERPLPSRPT